jgi:hypothetical protein
MTGDIALRVSRGRGVRRQAERGLGSQRGWGWERERRLREVTGGAE